MLGERAKERQTDRQAYKYADRQIVKKIHGQYTNRHKRATRADKTLKDRVAEIDAHSERERGRGTEIQRETERDRDRDRKRESQTTKRIYMYRPTGRHTVDPVVTEKAARRERISTTIIIKPLVEISQLNI